MSESSRTERLRKRNEWKDAEASGESYDQVLLRLKPLIDYISEHFYIEYNRKSIVTWLRNVFMEHRPSQYVMTVAGEPAISFVATGQSENPGYIEYSSIHVRRRLFLTENSRPKPYLVRAFRGFDVEAVTTLNDSASDNEKILIFTSNPLSDK